MKTDLQGLIRAAEELNFNPHKERNEENC